jgi:hypothetical protein
MVKAQLISRPVISHLPTWWEGESLYGWSARVHAERGGKARVTGRLLFGREHACRMIDIPAGLGRLEEATSGKLGSTEEILRQRTVLAAHWPFASDSTRKMVLDAAADVIGIPIPMALGLPASKLGAEHPLRYCETCHREALARDGYSTWLLRHQLPGVWWCREHGSTLHQVPKTRAIWRKPGSDAVPLGAPLNPEEREALRTMEQLASAIAGLAHVNEDSLAATAVHRLRQIGIATSAARLNAAKMSAWFESSPLTRWMRRQGELVHVLGGKWAIDMLRGRRRGHPLKWQILWTCAWQSEPTDIAVHSFVEAAQNTLPLCAADQPALWSEVVCESPRLSLPENVAQAFAHHDTLREVARELGVNIGGVQQWLADYPELATSWLSRVKYDRLKQAVSNIEDCMRREPTIARTQLLKACNTDFNWLSRNAPATVRSLLNRVPTDRGPQRVLF